MESGGIILYYIVCEFVSNQNSGYQPGAEAGLGIG